MSAGPRHHHLGEFEVRALSNARAAVRNLQREGLRHAYGLGPNLPLTPAERRDAAIIERAVDRLFRADDKRRR